MSEKLLEISGLSVCYEGEQILNNICFSVEKGETVGIAGESGSGKSTLLRAILRLMGKNGFITGGQITFRGEELTDMSEKKLRSLCGSEIGMIFQNTGASLCPTRKIGAQICESVRAHEKRCGFITPISGGLKNFRILLNEDETIKKNIHRNDFVVELSYHNKNPKGNRHYGST